MIITTQYLRHRKITPVRYGSVLAHVGARVARARVPADTKSSEDDRRSGPGSLLLCGKPNSP